MRKTIIVTLLLLIFIICLYGFIFINIADEQSTTQSGSMATAQHSVDSSKPLKGDSFESYFPLKTSEGYVYVGVAGLSSVDPSASSSRILSINYNDRCDCKLTYEFGRYPATTVDVLKTRQAYYAKFINGKKPIYAFSESIKTLPQIDYDNYYRYISVYSQDKSVESAFISSTSTYKSYQYFTHFLKDTSVKALKGKESVGTSVIIFPSSRTVVTIYFYNTIALGDSKIFTQKDMESVTKQIIDSVLGSKQ